MQHLSWLHWKKQDQQLAETAAEIPVLFRNGNGKIPLQAQTSTVKRADNDQDVSNKKSSPEKMIDGDKGSNSFTCTLDSIESDVLAGTSVYFQIDLGDVFKLDQVKNVALFCGRTYLPGYDRSCI